MPAPGKLDERRESLSPEKRALLEEWARGRPGPDKDLETIPRRADGVSVPASFSQRRLWVLDQLVPNSPAYNIPGAVGLRGKLDPDALERAIGEIEARHEALRTTFAAADGEPIQIVRPPSRPSLPIVDLRGLAPEERARETQRLIDEAGRRPFDLSNGPLFRTSLLRLGDEEHIFLIDAHHIVSDGWSQAIMLRELRVLYDAFLHGRPSPLSPLPVQYPDFALWQRECLKDESLQAHLSYWKDRLAGDLPVLDLPCDHPRPLVQTFRGDILTAFLPENLSRELTALARREGVTLFMVLVAAFKALLFRYTGQTDILIGTPVANRSRPELEGLIGFFVNTLVLRTDLSGEPTFRELLGRVREAALGAYAHQDLPFEKLVAEIDPKRDMSRNPLFQVMLVLQNMPSEEIGLTGLELYQAGRPNGTAKFDLWVSVQESARGLFVMIEYNTDLLEAATVTRLLGHFQTLLREIVARPEARVATLPYLTEAEGREIEAWNETQTGYPEAGRLLHELIESQARQTPEAPAVIFGDERLTYREFDRRASVLARYLRRLGVVADDLVGVAMERSVEMVTALAGIVKAGAAYVPLDPDYPPDRLAFMLGDSAVRVLLTQERLLEALPGGATRPGLRIICLDTGWSEVEREAATAGEDLTGPPEVGGGNLAYMIYTSGSTGRPKGAMNTHGGIVNRLLWMQAAYGLDSSDRVLQKTPFSFDVSVWEFFWPLITGACLVVAEPGGHRDPDYLVRVIREWEITTLHFVPSMLQAFLEADGVEECRSLRRVICSGEALPLQFQQRLYERLGAELHNLYGPTEAAVDVTSWACPRRPDRQIVPIGKPIANITIHILDAGFRPVPIGVPGELLIGGIGVARGYHGRPGLTAEMFVPDPFSSEPGRRLYRTGDLARYLPDGNIEFLGRIDYQVKLRGFRIELGEIEATLRGHPAVRDAVVLAREDEPGQRRLAAYLAPSSLGAAETSEEALPAAQPGAVGGRMVREQVLEWEKVFDETYGQVAPEADASFNVAGWNSSYDGAPIPDEQMREWVEATVERVLALHPRRVLEIGCGTGLLLWRITPHCEAYWGTDISGRALSDLGRELERRAAASGSGRLPVVLRRSPAHDLTWVQPGSFDGVILNSVVQYFPTLDYLVKVLEGAARAVRPGGFVFVGDVRSLPLLEAFRVSVELGRAPHLLTTERFRERVAHRVAQENELVIDPAFFEALGARIPEIGAAALLLKRGRHGSEMTRYRYDVVLRVGPERAPADAAPADATPTAASAWDTVPAWESWDERGLTLAGLGRVLAGDRPEVLAIAGVPDARLVGDIDNLELLRTAAANATVGDVLIAQAVGAETAAADPEEMWALGEELGYDVAASPAGSGREGRFDVVFRRRQSGADRGEPEESRVPWATRPSSGPPSVEPGQWDAYANNPLRSKIERVLVPELRGYLKEKLPEYMIPVAFVVMEALPLSPNGKIDRRALPRPPRPMAEAGEGFVSPRGGAEEALAAIWREVLGLEQVGVHANFFEFGGDSISGIQVIARANLAGLPLTTRHVFQFQTIAELAAVASELAAEGGQAGPRDVSPADRRDFGLTRHGRGDLEVLAPGPGNIADAYPVTGMQGNAIAHCDGAAAGGLYVTHQVWEMRGELNEELFRRAWQRVMDRHAVLRTSLLWSGVDEPLHVVRESLEVPIESADWRGLSPEERETRLAEHLGEIRRSGFALQATPQWRMWLFRTAEDVHYLVHAFSYILQDGWSYPILLKEVFTLYEAYRNGRDADLPEPRPYRDFIAWLRSQDRRGAEAFWKKALAGVDGPTPVVTAAGARSAYGAGPGGAVGVRGGPYVTHGFSLSGETTAALASLARRNHLTFSTLIQGAWAAVLGASTGRSDVLFGFIVSGRPAALAGVELMVGQFNSILPLRVRVTPEATLGPWMADLQSQVAEIRDYEWSPLQSIREWTGVPDHEALFQSYLVFENYPMDPPLPGAKPIRSILAGGDRAGRSEPGAELRARPLSGLAQTEHPLRVEVFPAPTLVVNLCHYREAFAAGTISNLARGFQAALEVLPAGPGQRLARLLGLAGSGG